MSNTKISPYAVEPEKGYNYRTAMEEACRCLLCHDAPCSDGCPAGTNPAKFIRSLRFKNLYGAAETIRENNPLGGCCANVCPQARLCEEACSRCGIDKPIEIGRIQKFLVEQEKEQNMSFVAPGEPNGKRVACVGAGPSSLACARELAVQGFDVTVYEANEKPGGMLTYGILPSRLPQEIVDFDIAQIEKAGVKILCGHRVDQAGLEELKQTYDAVYVGIGLWLAKRIDIPGADLDGVEDALEFLRTARTDTEHLRLGKKVVIIGGGDVAMDCASTAKQLGAETAIVYRRTLEEAPASMKELSSVMEMGVPVITRFSPTEIFGEDGKVTALVAKGRDDDSFLKLMADQVIFAVGQAKDPAASFFEEGDGVFLGGDMLYGKGRSVVESVADGKIAAFKILSALGKED